MFKVFRLQEFERRMNKFLTKEEQIRVDKIEDEIAKNGFTGNPLSFKFLREKRIDGKRIYFLVYEDLKCALIISVSNKKTQQETIDAIKSRLPEYYDVVKEAIRQHGEYDHV